MCAYSQTSVSYRSLSTAVFIGTKQPPRCPLAPPASEPLADSDVPASNSAIVTTPPRCSLSYFSKSFTHNTKPTESTLDRTQSVTRQDKTRQDFRSQDKTRQESCTHCTVIGEWRCCFSSLTDQCPCLCQREVQQVHTHCNRDGGRAVGAVCTVYKNAPSGGSACPGLSYELHRGWVGVPRSTTEIGNFQAEVGQIGLGLMEVWDIVRNVEDVRDTMCSQL
jgi:hypothetical protein